MDQDVEYLRSRLALAKLVGQAPSFLAAIASLPLVAQSEATVLLEGETGTGKELVARALHYLSPRAPFPFLAVNCGTFADSLLEAELFGHERGAFTDAHVRRPGLISQAERGTLFLDEVDSLSSKAQVSLLRVLQEKSYRSVGASAEQQADVRVVVASNSGLEQLLASRAFRADLYYRLCVFTVSLPPLRQRREDILLLANHFLDKHAPADRPARRLTPAACAALLAHDWPGNIRELENTIIRCSHLCRGVQIDAEDLRLAAPAPNAVSIPEAPAGELGAFKDQKQRALADFERDYLARLMYLHQGNVSQAARSSGKDRRDLRKLLQKYQLDPKSFHAGPAG
jgi:DNA-binding NtrC family response regulator